MTTSPTHKVLERKCDPPASGTHLSSPENNRSWSSEPANSHISVTISPDLDKKLESLANRTGRTKGEILLGGISLIELAIMAKEEGKKFGVAEQDLTLITEVVL